MRGGRKDLGEDAEKKRKKKTFPFSSRHQRNWRSLSQGNRRGEERAISAVRRNERGGGAVIWIRKKGEKEKKAGAKKRGRKKGSLSHPECKVATSCSCAYRKKIIRDQGGKVEKGKEPSSILPTREQKKG